LASTYKVGFHRERLAAYLRGESVFPITLELDLTSQCTRSCPECPSSTAPTCQLLNLPFLEQLFGFLEGQTPGLLLTGGEPTLAPLFPDALRLARSRGFRDIAVVTNGSLLDQPSVANALLRDVTTIRLSMYDWEKGSSPWTDGTLKRIEWLRKRADEGSQLRIGVSALTSRYRVGKLRELMQRVRSAGAHWLYFHPLCAKWGLGCPELEEQDGVTAEIASLCENGRDGFRVFFFPSRYQSTSLRFNSYHAAHFLLVIGADGKNYLGPEVKYQPEYVIRNLQRGQMEAFLWEEDRLNLIRSRSDQGYPPVPSRHRSILYSDFIELLLQRDQTAMTEWEKAATQGFLFPYIL